MRIDIITVLPQLLESFFKHSIIGRAVDSEKVIIHTHNLRDYSEDRHRRVDDYQYGGGSGMVMRIEPIDNCIATLKSQRRYDEIIYMAPDGEPFSQSIANQLSTYENIILLCGHYKGIDHRVREFLITRELSIGDYVLSGGEIPAAVVTDAIIRLLPGVIGDETSALTDSFQNGVVAPPIYTRPRSYKGLDVPEILTSGNFKKMQLWENQQVMTQTRKKRPKLIENQ